MMGWAWKGLWMGGKKQNCSLVTNSPFQPLPLHEAGHPPQASVFQTGTKALAGPRATGMSTQ